MVNASSTVDRKAKASNIHIVKTSNAIYCSSLVWNTALITERYLLTALH